MSIALTVILLWMKGSVVWNRVFLQRRPSRDIKLRGMMRRKKRGNTIKSPKHRIIKTAVFNLRTGDGPAGQNWKSGRYCLWNLAYKEPTVTSSWLYFAQRSGRKKDMTTAFLLLLLLAPESSVVLGTIPCLKHAQRRRYQRTVALIPFLFTEEKICKEGLSIYKHMGSVSALKSAPASLWNGVWKFSVRQIWSPCLFFSLFFPTFFVH